MTVERLSAIVRRGALLLAVLAVSGWAIPTGQVAASRLPMGHAGLGAGHRANERRGLSLSQLPYSLANAIRQTLARQQQDDYRILAQSHRYLAASPGQNMQIAFIPAGPRLSGRCWTWGMRLAGMGRSRINPVATGTMILQGSQLAYRRGHLTEWYRNSSSGLEQGFTLGARPAGSGGEGITLQLALSGSLRAHLERGGQELGLSLPNGQRVLRYGGLAAHDAVGRTLPAHLELTGQHLRLVVQDRGARYPVQIDPRTYQAQLDLGAGAGHDGLHSVALSSDGNTALLGAPYRTVNGQSAAGTGEVFTRSGTTWSYQSQLDLATAAVAGDELGASVALSSDGNTALLGAPNRTVNGQSYAGAGEVFTRSGATWTYQSQLDLGTGAATDFLSISVALSSDGTTSLLGAYSRTVNGQRYAGAGEVFIRSGATWTYQAQLDLGTSAAAYDHVAISVALSRDATTALLGTGDRTVSGHTDAGAGEVFTRSGTTWSYQTQLDLGTSAAAYDKLGNSVALSSDGNTALLAASGRTVNGQSTAGAGEVFTHSGTSWTYQVQLDLRTGAAANDILGTSVALSSDGNTALLGARDRMVNGQSAAGAGEVFTRSGTTWSYQAQLDLGANAANDGLGGSVALSSDGNTALLGAPFRTVNGQTQAGAGEVFGSSAPTVARVLQLSVHPPAASLTTRQRAGMPLQFRWRMATQTGVAGFNLYAGSHQLNARPIPIHSSPAYRYTVRAHPRLSRQSASFSLHVLLADGAELIISVRG